MYQKLFLERLPKEEYLTNTLQRQWDSLFQKDFPALWNTKNIPPNKYHKEILSEHLIRCYNIALKKSKDPILSLGCFLHDIGKVETIYWDKRLEDWTFHGHEIIGAQIVNSWMALNKFDRIVIDRVTRIVRHHGFRFYTSTKDSTIKRWLIELQSEQGFRDIMEAALYDREANLCNINKPSQTREWLALNHKINTWSLENQILFPAQLALEGQEIAGSLVKKGSDKEVINDIIYLCNKNPEKNTKEYLSKYIDKINRR